MTEKNVEKHESPKKPGFLDKIFGGVEQPPQKVEETKKEETRTVKEAIHQHEDMFKELNEKVNVVFGKMNDSFELFDERIQEMQVQAKEIKVDESGVLDTTNNVLIGELAVIEIPAQKYMIKESDLAGYRERTKALGIVIGSVGFVKNEEVD